MVKPVVKYGEMAIFTVGEAVRSTCGKWGGEGGGGGPFPTRQSYFGKMTLQFCFPDFELP